MDVLFAPQTLPSRLQPLNFNSDCIALSCLVLHPVNILKKDAIVKNENRDNAKKFQLRDLSVAELQKLQQVSHSRVVAKREVERAQMLVSFHAGMRVEDVAQKVGRTMATVYLIEPWWKTFKSSALKGQCFQTSDEIVTAITWATQYWNAHKKPYVWRKVFV